MHVRVIVREKYIPLLDNYELKPSKDNFFEMPTQLGRFGTKTT
jgi:hypothetical protein